MTRHLTKQEISKIKAFSKSVGAVITPWQPTDSQEKRDSAVPGYIKDLLLELVPLSSNDHLVDYAQALKEYDNQEDILQWLEGIKALKSNVITLDQDKDSLYRNIYRQAFYLAKSTNLDYAAKGMQALSKLPYILTKESMIEKFKKLKEVYNVAQANKPAKKEYYEPDVTYVSTDEILEQVQSKRHRALLYRTCSDSASLAQKSSISHQKYEQMNPLKPGRIFNPIKRNI